MVAPSERIFALHFERSSFVSARIVKKIVAMYSIIDLFGMQEALANVRSVLPPLRTDDMAPLLLVKVVSACYPYVSGRISPQQE